MTANCIRLWSNKLSPPMTRPLSPRIIASSFCALLLSSCAAVGPNFAPPAAVSATPGYLPPTDKASALVAATPDAVARDWWTLMPSPDLDQVIRMTLAGNLDLDAANASLDSARAELAAARGAQLPDINASSSAARERLNLASFGFGGSSGGPSFPNNPEFSIYSVGAMASFPLDAFGGLRRGTESAAARLEAQVHQRDAAWLTLGGQAATLAVTIAVLRAELAEVDQIIADDRQNLDLVARAEQAGAEPHSAGVSASAQLAADLTLVPPLRRQLDVARHGLAVLVGKAPADWSPPDFDLTRLPMPQTLPVALPSALVHARPDILAAEARLHAATADIGVARARLYPNITLSAGITQGSLTPEKVFDYKYSAFSLIGGVTQPIFDGGRLKAGVTAAEARRRMAFDTYQQTVLHAFGQVADLMQSIAHDEEALAAQRNAEGQAVEALRLARLAYGAGGTGLFPVIDAARQLSNARLGLVRAEGQLRLDAVALFVATGRGLASPRP